MASDCLFCKIVNGEIPSEKVFEDDDVLAFKDIDPKAPVHLLVIPKKHYSTLLDCDDATLLGKLVTTATSLAKKEGIDTSGYRVVINCNKDGGQAVYHIHLHLLGGRSLSWPPG